MPFDISHICIGFLNIRTGSNRIRNLVGAHLFKTSDLCQKLLRTALSEDSLPRLISLLNRFKRVEFRNCHQLYSCWQLPM